MIGLTPLTNLNFHVIPPALTPDKLRAMYLTMLVIRNFEETAEQSYLQGKLHGTMHLSIGQEGVAVGANAALAPTDYLLNTHRGHGHTIAKGADVRRMMAEFMGKATGFCHGLGGSMHIADVSTRNLGANGIVGGGIPLAVGVGLSLKMRQTGEVVMAVFGDGASNEGAFHESLNLAAMWHLPVVWLCENNQYAMSMPVRRGMNIEHIAERAAAYGMPGVTVDGQDTLAVYHAVELAADRARHGNGPSLVEAVTYRYKGHSRSDAQRYRTRDEVDQWKQRDPLDLFRNVLITNGLLTAEDADDLAAKAKAILQDAVRFAEASPEPSPDEMEKLVYA